MALSELEVLRCVERLTVARLHTWIETGCVRPQAPEAAFTEVDVARLRLLCELQDDLGVNDDALPVVLSLTDQIHGLRQTLRRLARAVEAQPRPVRDEIARALREHPEERAQATPADQR